MKRRLFGLAALASAGAAVAAAVVLAGGEAGAGPSASPAKRQVVRVPFSGAVYRLTITARLKGRDARATEWVAPASGSWRIEAGDVTYLSSPRKYVVRSEPTGIPYVRTGSPAFLGDLRELSFGIGPLRRYLGLDRETAARLRVSRTGGKVTLHVAGGVPRTVTIERRLTAAEARSQSLFELRWGSGRNEFRQVPVGRRAGIGVRGFWFGPSVLDRQAVIATEWLRTRSEDEVGLGVPARSEMQVHTTHYVPVSANGRTSLSSNERPDGEIQVVSEPLASAHAQFALEVFGGRNGELETAPWPRTTIRLRGGEQATVIPDMAESSPDARTSFAVVTADTLVFVVGSFTDKEVAALARQLRALE